MVKRIAVPETAVRSAEEILKGLLLTHDGKVVWTPCWHCGGTGNYPSSMTPPGKCRLYCWAVSTGDPFNPHRSKSADDPTYGLLPTVVAKYVKRAQANDRRDYRARVRADQQAAERAVRLQSVDPRITTLAAAFSIVVGGSQSNLPAYWNDDHDYLDQYHRPSQNYLTALNLVEQWANKGELSDAQWVLVSALPTQEAERQARQAAKVAERAARTHVGQVGDRVEVRGTVQRVSSFQSPSFRGYGLQTRYVVRLLTVDGNVVSWFADYSPVQLDDDGKVVGSPTLTLKGTVKKHDEYKGEKQTVLFRVKVSD